MRICSDLIKAIRLSNWRAHGYTAPMCEHYIGGGDWDLDCDLKYGLCNGRASETCPVYNPQYEEMENWE